LARATLFKAVEIVPDNQLLARLKALDFDLNKKVIISRELARRSRECGRMRCSHPRSRWLGTTFGETISGLEHRIRRMNDLVDSGVANQPMDQA
jgi:hypothetical protein